MSPLASFHVGRDRNANMSPLASFHAGRWHPERGISVGRLFVLATRIRVSAEELYLSPQRGGVA